MFFNTLPPEARELFTAVGKLEAVRGFYLAGGSAAALHLGHRVSVDLDFFGSEGFAPEVLTRELTTVGSLTIQQQDPNTLLGLLSNVRISFFGYPYPLIEASAAYEGIRVASLRDLGLMKCVAISQRGRKRDFVDLYYICEAGIALEELLKQMPRKYREVTYPSYHLLRSLTYFDDAENDPDPDMLIPWDWRAIRGYFETEALRLSQDFSA